MGGLFTHLFSPPPPEDVFHPAAMVLFLLFLVGLTASVVMSGKAAGRFVAHPVPREAIQHIAGVCAYICGAAVFFFVIRFLQINPFSFGCPFWIWLCVIALIVYLVRERLRWNLVMAEAVAKHDKQQVKQQYLQAAKDNAAQRKRRSA